MPTVAAIRTAINVRESQASSTLTEHQAKLYSHSIRLQTGQAGLASFRQKESSDLLDDALLLIECALVERKGTRGESWRLGIKRAGQILEWLSYVESPPLSWRLYYLAAAAYQLAGFPALASGHLRRLPANEHLSSLLRKFLSADFLGTLVSIRNFWAGQRELAARGIDLDADFALQTVRHIVMAIGTVCGYLRSGQDGTTERALRKLDKLASAYVHTQDSLSWILARLTSEACRQYVERSVWKGISQLQQDVAANANEALIQFARACFVNNRALIWPAQSVGIDRLKTNGSFVLCTPTGSGKTSVATLGIIQALFSAGRNLNGEDASNLVIYLVPSRALAAEVEARLAEDLRTIAAEPVVVTGLYGGTDWGPTDAWIDRDERTIVICTFEKADALIRYLGIFFLNRVRLVVIDEVHTVNQEDRSSGASSDLDSATSRQYRLELLGARLIRARDEYEFRVIALSAVAGNAAPALSRWLSTDGNADPAVSDYRSTRQMLGRLEVDATGGFRISYDLMDGKSLEFQEQDRQDSPFISSPFPSLPGGVDDNLGPEKRMRAPTLWAALHLAAERTDGSRPSVLISLTQSVDAFASDCLGIVSRWTAQQLPRYKSLDEQDVDWQRCIASVRDYFGVESTEYRLLILGIAVHHGRMPALVSRRLKRVIDRGFVRVIIATSTLSEGVNIPVTHILIPSIYRGQHRLSVQELSNLIGRAGRPGIGTEGTALVVLPMDHLARGRGLGGSRQRQGYFALIRELVAVPNAGDSATSALGLLLEKVEDGWRELTGGGTPEEFTSWLEQTIVNQTDEHPALQRLDALDGFLLATIQEVADLEQQEIAPLELEEKLTDIWRKTYAFAARREEDRLRSIWLARGRTIPERFPNAQSRRRIYKTSLTPRSALTLIAQVNQFRELLQQGAGYAALGTEEKFEFIRGLMALISEIPVFRISSKLGRRRNFLDWPSVLRWWLAKETLARQPSVASITDWHYFVSQNFIYRATWGMGSLLGLLLAEPPEGEPVRPLEINDWPRSGLPWIAFWVKELLTWGTLDPVAAFLLARGAAIDRQSAEREAQGYYDGIDWLFLGANEVLDPRAIRDWVETRIPPPRERARVHEIGIPARLAKEARAYRTDHMFVTPIVQAGSLDWIDSAGYLVATSQPVELLPEDHELFEFELMVTHQVVVSKRYLAHA